MNNENIKEILDKLTDEDWYEEKDLTGTKWIELKQEETNLLYDYITNLQEKYDKALTDLVQESHTRMELENKITNLQEENQALKNQLDFIGEQNHIIDKLKKENEIIKSQLNICSQDLYMENLKLKLENERLNNVINEANKCILEFIQTEDYNKVDGLAIADNYMRLMQILETKIEENNK